MLLTFILLFAHHNAREIQQKSYTILGYPAYIKYFNDGEKDHILSVLKQDPDLSEMVRHAVVMEPYMIGFESNNVFLDNNRNNNQLNLTVPSEAFQASGAPKLSQRSTLFASDEDAWQAILNDPHYVILDHKYSFEPSEWPNMNDTNRWISRKLNVGDRLTINVYRDYTRLTAPGEVKTVGDSIDIEIIGFADTSTGMEFYNVMFVHPDIHEQLKEHGYRWEYLREQGYIMLSLPSGKIQEIRKIEELISARGMDGFYAPIITGGSEDLNLIQMMWVFIGFMTLAMNIGLAGLAILQYRAVQERAKTLAMMRCIGLGTRLIRQMLLLEGTMIGWLGLLNGWLFGSIGGYIIVMMLEGTKSPTEASLSFSYPWELILPVVGTLMLITLLLNLAPSRTILRLSPSEAIRSANE